MSYPKAMPQHIQPYPQDVSPVMPDYLMSQHLYRTTYPQPTFQSKETRYQEEACPVTVPSTPPISVPGLVPNALDYFHPIYYANHQVTYQRQGGSMLPHPYHIPHSPVVVQPPIHHTLENATITYDTVPDQALQKDLVKDVFFSPAMVAGEDASVLCSSAASSCGSQSDCESDESVSTPSRSSEDDDITFSPPITPTDLLDSEEDQLLFFGLDLFEEEKPISLCFSRNKHSLPTTQSYRNDTKRRRDNDSTTQDIKKQKKLLDFYELPSSPSFPPQSPRYETADYFDDASGEESSDDDDDQVSLTERPSYSQCTVDPFGCSDFQSISVYDLASDSEDDSCSVSSWEGQRADASEESSDEEQATNSVEQTVNNHHQNSESVPPRPTTQPTIYQKLTKANVDWCRYCGTTEGVNWRPGPWGKRTLCNKHGCDYKGYGFACKLPRLDLTGFADESIDDRDRPVLQLYCSTCQRQESHVDNVLVRCEGCPKAYHQKCCHQELTNTFVASDEAWFCDAACRENARRKRIVVELPRKRLPLMCAPKNAASSSAITSENMRTRSLRESR
ncbi:hypothetical protein DFQ28_008324 [Apophysomyces sp. BC1034]|nr:hypothetical protein DFQ30_008132 [Apophysomyces sp. BC1015]KAG0175525.1 hypothetical protein DFQ29_007126 [Apophysomyces sp. BC1021]KAG0186103.1 hypothetical protein DFQ28_008324 [Apophysomyces sp. BC1034]